MECFIVEEGVERKAELEDILPLIGESGIQHFFRDAYRSGINLPYALAHMANEMKKLVYRNLLMRIRGTIAKDIEDIESRCKKDCGQIQDARAELISFIERNKKWLYGCSERLAWKETKPKEQLAPIEKLIKMIEEACYSWRLYLSISYIANISKEDIRKAFSTFQGRKNELHNIRTLSITAKDLPAAALLFEAGGIENLLINGKLTGLSESPSWIHNISLRHLSLSYGPTFIPDWIGDIQSLKGLTIEYTNVKKLPDSIGNLFALKELILEQNDKLKSLPDSIGNLKNLARLSVRWSAIEKLPDTLANCSSLEYVDARNTSNSSFPDFISSIKIIKQSPEVIPKKRSISYLSFCNYYYTLTETIILFLDKARREGLLALEEELENTSEDFFREGIRLVVDGTDDETTQHILTLKIERESDPYKKKLMEIAMQGILCISRRDDISDTCIRLATMVDIKNNPLDVACAKYLAGDYKAFHDIDFKEALQPEEEREEIRFIKRAYEIINIYNGWGLVEVEKCLDKDGIAARDVFEYGLSILVDGFNYEDTDKVLTMLITYATDPVRKNISMAKREAIKMIYGDQHPELIKKTLIAYFDDDIAGEFK